MAVEDKDLEDSDDLIVSRSMTRVTPEHVRAAEDLRASEQALSRLLDDLPVGIFQIDAAGVVTFANEGFRAVVGGNIGESIQTQMSSVVAEDRPILDAAIKAVLADQPIDDVEMRLDLSTEDGTVIIHSRRACLLSLRPLTDSTGAVVGGVGCLNDVTNLVHLRDELESRASIDALTSCMNRRATLELLGQISATPQALGEGVAIVFADIDRFKSVNDRFGHAGGDRVLAEVASSLRAAVRECDHVGRLGGDEFLLICRGVESADQAVGIAEHVRECVAATIDVRNRALAIKTSVGVAWTNKAIDVDTFIAQADSAMYESKKHGRNAVSLFVTPGSDRIPTPMRQPSRTRRRVPRLERNGSTGAC